MSPSVASQDAPVFAAHDAHQLIGLTGLVDAETRVGYLACTTCGVLLAPLRRCARPKKDGGVCRAFVREDLGHDRCWSHGEGAGRTSTPRRLRRAL